MVEFKTAYTPMDKEYYTGSASSAPTLEKPIVSMGKIGQTFPEHGRTKNIVREAEAAIRAGAGVLQLVMEREGATPVGRGPSTHGKEVRQAIREVMYANNVLLEGLELPTSTNNMTGLTQQGFQEAARHQNIEQVKEAIRFAADIARGGSVDILSQEFQRPVALADWNQIGKWKGTFEGTPDEKNTAVFEVVNVATGQKGSSVDRKSLPWRPVWKIATESEVGVDQSGKKVSIQKGDFIDYQGRKIMDLTKRVPQVGEDGLPIMTQSTWKYLQEEAALITKQRQNTFVAAGKSFGEGDKCTEEEAALILQNAAKKEQAYGASLEHSRQTKELIQKLNDLKRMKGYYVEQEKGMGQQELDVLKRELKFEGIDGISLKRTGKPSEVIDEQMLVVQRRLDEASSASIASLQQKYETEAFTEKFRRVDQYATEKAMESYAELGMFAWEETRANPKKVTRPLCVGPENGFDYAYGGHPDEFIGLIDGARAKMVERLKNRGGMSEHEAKEAAKLHIKGVFDTGHLATFLGSFRPEKDPKTSKPIESEDRRIELFNEWYLEQIDKLAKRHDTISAIQAVDAAGPEHSHLPPGQGIFPVKTAVERIVKAGFGGAIVSEGHEEDGRYGDARILTKTWEEFTVSTGQSYGQRSGSTPWGGPNGTFQGYFGKIQSPTMMVGAYVPSNEFRLWSETPLE